MQTSTTESLPPLAIGGLGGSGTRLLAGIVRELGFYIGHDLNKALDNLFFTLLFRRKNILLESEDAINRLFDLLLVSLRGARHFDGNEIRLLESLTHGRRHNFSEEWLRQRLSLSLQQDIGEVRGLIAWKEPNTHVFLDCLLDHDKEIKYIHVIRNGLDMAISDNQHQLLMWGDCFLNRPVRNSPDDALKYWNAIHERILSIYKANSNRMHFVNYDWLCSGRIDQLDGLFDFIGIKPDKQVREDVIRMIKPPDSIGRYKTSNLSSVLNEDNIQKHDTIMNTLETL